MPRDGQAAVAQGVRQRRPRRADKNAAASTRRAARTRWSTTSVEDDDDASRFAGQLHLTAAERARRTAGARSKPKPRRQPSRRAPATGAHGFSRPTAPIVREVAIGETITVADLAQKLALKGGDVVKALFKMGVMATINQVIDHDTAALVTEELGHKAVQAPTTTTPRTRCSAHVEDDAGRASARVRRWSPSWATSTTARPRCSTTSAAPRSPPAKPAASPSTSARTTSKPTRASSASSTPRATRRSPRCARAAPSSPTSWCWWSPPTTASCRRRSKRCSTRKRGQACR